MTMINIDHRVTETISYVHDDTVQFVSGFERWNISDSQRRSFLEQGIDCDNFNHIKNFIYDSEHFPRRNNSENEPSLFQHCKDAVLACFVKFVLIDFRTRFENIDSWAAVIKRAFIDKMFKDLLLRESIVTMCCIDRSSEPSTFDLCRELANWRLAYAMYIALNAVKKDRGYRAASAWIGKLYQAVLNAFWTLNENLQYVEQDHVDKYEMTAELLYMLYVSADPQAIDQFKIIHKGNFDKALDNVRLGRSVLSNVRGQALNINELSRRERQHTSSSSYASLTTVNNSSTSMSPSFYSDQRHYVYDHPFNRADYPYAAPPPQHQYQHQHQHQYAAYMPYSSVPSAPLAFPPPPPLYQPPPPPPSPTAYPFVCPMQPSPPPLISSPAVCSLFSSTSASREQLRLQRQDAQTSSSNEQSLSSHEGFGSCDNEQMTGRSSSDIVVTHDVANGAHMLLQKTSSLLYGLDDFVGDKDPNALPLMLQAAWVTQYLTRMAPRAKSVTSFVDKLDERRKVILEKMCAEMSVIGLAKVTPSEKKVITQEVVDEIKLVSTATFRNSQSINDKVMAIRSRGVL